MFLVAGLGNPGEQYAATPHNMGFLVVERLAARHAIRVTRKECQALVGQGTIGGKPVLLAKPQTFMNLSGVAIKPLMERSEIAPSGLILVYDELDLPWGALRVRPRGSAAGHKGARDVIAKLGTQDFARVRLGVHPGYPSAGGAEGEGSVSRHDALRHEKTGADYLLSRFTRRQSETLDKFIDLAADATESIIAEGAEKSMTRFNGRAQGSTQGSTTEE